MLRQLPQFTRRILCVVIGLAGVGYLTSLVSAYLSITSQGISPSGAVPDGRDLDRLLFGSRDRQPGLIEQLLEATEGPLKRGGSMRPAFTDESTGWEALTQNMSPAEKAALLGEREGERLAVLAWIRSGLSREPYEANDFRLDDSFSGQPITAAFLATKESPEANSHRSVRIRSIVAERCATCHSENGRNEHARWIPLETYADVESKCRPDVTGVASSAWPKTVLMGLLPLELFAGLLFLVSSAPPKTRVFLTGLTCLALVVMFASWLIGRQGTSAVYWLLGAAALAAIGIKMQMLGCLADLLTKKRA